jgi:hypothetical protein
MTQILTIKFILIFIGLVGAIDEYIYHFRKVELHKKSECRTENTLHIVRQFSFSAVFFIAASIEVTGIFAILLMVLLSLDIFIGFADVIVEPKSRAKSGGIPGGEYFLHMLLSFALGIFHFNYFSYLTTKTSALSAYTVNIDLTSIEQIALLIMSTCSFLMAFTGFILMIKRKNM